MNRPQHLNKIATAAMIPLVAVGFFVALRAMESEPARPFVPEGLLVLANLRDESLTFFDFAGGERLEVELAGPPHEMVEVGGTLFVTLGRKDALAQIDIASRTVERYLVLDGSPHGIATDGTHLFVSLDDANAIAVLDIETLAESRRLETGNTPHAIALLGETLFVANATDGTVSAIGENSQVTRQSGKLAESLAVASASSLAVANASDGTVALFALPGMDQAALYVVEGRPVRIVLFGGQLLVARSRAGDVAVLDPVGGGLRATVAIGRLADGLCVAPSGEWVAAAANGDNTLHIIDTVEWRSSMEYDTEDGPGACLWLAVD
jgi:DNA-binding beta-propeller fold protein YncE